MFFNLQAYFSLGCYTPFEAPIANSVAPGRLRPCSGSYKKLNSCVEVPGLG